MGTLVFKIITNYECPLATHCFLVVYWNTERNTIVLNHPKGNIWDNGVDGGSQRVSMDFVIEWPPMSLRFLNINMNVFNFN